MYGTNLVDRMIELLQRGAGGTDYSPAAAELSTDEFITALGWEPLNKRRDAHVYSFVTGNENDVPDYLSNYFKIRTSYIHDHNTRNKTILFWNE